MKELLLRLFEECLHREYREVENAASYSYGREKNGDGECLFIFFQKSHGVTDWLNNLDFSAKPYEEMDPPWNCHVGFLRVWNSVKRYLKPHILDPNINRAVIVGYSHGAALAILCHEYIWYHRPDLRTVIEGYGFGCPRVVWGKLHGGRWERWQRFTVIRNLDDFVTHLPPSFLGYTHVGELLEIGEQGKYSTVDAHRAENILMELRVREGRASISLIF